jgi:hypothetical protein
MVPRWACYRDVLAKPYALNQDLSSTVISDRDD